MKATIITFVLVALGSCNNPDNYNQTILNDNEWFDALEIAITFAEINSSGIGIYECFDNCKLKNELYSAYQYGAENFDYIVSDSILNFILDRGNSKIVNKIDTLFDVRFVNDTSNLDEYLLLSEPFYIDSQLLCYSMLYKNSEVESFSCWVYYIQKHNGSIKTLAIYDINGDAFYEAQPLN